MAVTNDHETMKTAAGADQGDGKDSPVSLQRSGCPLHCHHLPSEHARHNREASWPIPVDQDIIEMNERGIHHLANDQLPSAMDQFQHAFRSIRWLCSVDAQQASNFPLRDSSGATAASNSDINRSIDSSPDRSSMHNTQRDHVHWPIHEPTHDVQPTSKRARLGGRTELADCFLTCREDRSFIYRRGVSAASLAERSNRAKISSKNYQHYKQASARQAGGASDAQTKRLGDRKNLDEHPIQARQGDASAGIIPCDQSHPMQYPQQHVASNKPEACHTCRSPHGHAEMARLTLTSAVIVYNMALCYHLQSMRHDSDLAAASRTSSPGRCADSSAGRNHLGAGGAEPDHSDEKHRGAGSVASMDTTAGYLPQDPARHDNSESNMYRMRQQCLVRAQLLYSKAAKMLDSVTTNHAHQAHVGGTDPDAISGNALHACSASMSHTIALLRLVLWNNLTHCSVRMHSRDASRNVQQLLWVCKTTLNHPSATTDSEDQHAQTSADKRDQPASYGHVEANHDPDLPRTSEHAARALVTSVSYVETSMGAFGNAPTGWVLRSCVRVILHHALWMQHRSQSSAPAA